MEIHDNDIRDNLAGVFMIPRDKNNLKSIGVKVHDNIVEGNFAAPIEILPRPIQGSHPLKEDS